MDASVVQRLKKIAAAEKRTLSAQINFILERGLTNLSKEERAVVEG